MKQVLLSLQVIKVQKDIKGVHIVSSEFCPFFGGRVGNFRLQFLSHFIFNFENLSVH